VVNDALEGDGEEEEEEHLRNRASNLGAEKVVETAIVESEEP